METTAENLSRFSPLPLRAGRRLRNRIAVPPMASETADPAGFVTPRTLEHYTRLAGARPGLLMVEYSFVHPSGRSEENQLGIDRDAQLPGLAAVAALIRRSGAVAGIQLSHGGGKSSRELTGGALMGPSGIAVPARDEVLETPAPMTAADIELWQLAFVEAAGRAVRAGFELVEFHAAHGYGLNQWLSPLTNARCDLYGGSLEKRFRLLEEVIRAVRAAHPSLLLSARIPGQDHLPGGLTVSEMRESAQRLESLGLDILSISSGIGGWRRPRDRAGEGYLVPEAEAIQDAVSIPVIGVGGIERGETIDGFLRARRLSIAAVGRAILKDPGGWSAANLAGAEARVS